jgi:SAM-dependent methyltransferase
VGEATGETRKSVCLGMPGYAAMTGGAARGFYRASRTLDVRLHQTESSLLAHNMNRLWCWALNTAHKGDPVHYFAMQHSDIEPEDFWLDKLAALLDETGLDVLGVVAPIKDQRGVTSTAVARPDTNWRVAHRLTMREVHRLPETFTSADVGGPLLLNTGLWVCRFDEAWAKKVHFEINDRIYWDPTRKEYTPEVEPEDWFVSRLFHELGLKVGCTRAVELGHRGAALFGNTNPWGTNDFDREYLSASTVAAPERFPHDVPGWLTEAEGAELARLAAGRDVVEVGSYCGRSTVCLARAANHVTAVDTFDGTGTATPGDTFRAFARNVAKYGLSAKVSPVRGASAEVLPDLPAVFDLAFIDGSHDRDSVRTDAALAAAVLRPGGLLAFHDYGKAEDPGVTAAVDELLAAGAELLGRVDSLAIVKPSSVLEPVGV